MTENPADPAARIATSYFDALRAGDIATLRAMLADDVTFAGPLGTAANADECAEGLRRLSEITTDVVIRKMISDGHDVITWFDLHTQPAAPMPVANWTHVADGKITRIRATFDPRPLFDGPHG